MLNPGGPLDTSPGSPAIRRRSLPRRILNRLEIDQAVFYAIAARAWQFVAGPISILVIAACFTPELQGYFYTFASLMGMQTLAELGLHAVIITVCAHEWSQLDLASDGTVTGDEGARHRLAALKQFVSRWYAVVGLIFVLGCGLGGAVFLNQRPAIGIHWMAPWFCLVALNGLLLWAWAFSAMLEGCNQMAVVNRVRLLQFISGSLAVWISMAAGLGLWAAVVSAAVRVVGDYWLIAVRYRRFWQSLSVVPTDVAISWRKEIWPLQWKMAVSGVASYLALGLIIPVMFYFHGPVVAGQMGMTWTILTAIELAAYSWVHARGPRFGMLAARQDWTEMDRIYSRLIAISWSFYLLAVIGLCAGVWGLNALPWSLSQRLATRLLPLSPTVVFSVAFLLQHLPRCQSIYVRAHKRDPFLIAGLVSNLLLAVLVVGLGAVYGPGGAAWGYLTIVILVNVPWWSSICQRCRREWHFVPEQTATS